MYAIVSVNEDPCFEKNIRRGTDTKPFVVSNSLADPGGSAPRLPRNWQEIGIGDLVLANQDRWEGWYEAIVVEQNGDMFTLRWRDNPRERRIVRHRLRLGLLYPRPRPTAENGKSAKASAHAKHDKTVATNPDANSQSLPKNWDEIDHLVLAKDDSQWGAWWEAIPGRESR